MPTFSNPSPEILRADLLSATGADQIGYIADSADALARTVQRRLRDVRTVYDFGAVGDGVADDTAALQAFYDAPPGMKIIPEGDFRITSTVEASQPGEYITQVGTIRADTDGDVALRIGTLNASYSGSYLNARVRRTTRTDWTDEDDVGVEVLNARFCHMITLGDIRDFTIGARFRGDGSGADLGGCANLTVGLGFIYNAKYGLDITNSATSGYCNEILWLGGQVTAQSSVPGSQDTYGVRMRDPRGNSMPNNHVFKKLSVEMNIDARGGVGKKRIARIEGGRLSRWENLRAEQVESVLAEILPGPYEDHIFEPGYSDEDFTIDDQSDTGRNTVVNLSRVVPRHFSEQVWSSGMLAKKSCDYDGNGDVYTPRLFWVSTAGGTTFRASSGATMAARHLALTGAFVPAVRVQVPASKKLLVRTATANGNVGRIGVACFNAAGVRLTGTAPVYARGTALGYVTNYGGIYRPGSDGANEQLLTFHDDVDHVWVLPSCGGTSHLQSFEISTSGKQALSVETIFRLNDSDRMFGTVDPVLGTYEQGEVIWSRVQGSSGKAGRYCITGGSPGTWREFGAIDAA